VPRWPRGRRKPEVLHRLELLGELLALHLLELLGELLELLLRYLRHVLHLLTHLRHWVLVL
jgi:hypothetical protein